MQATVQFISSNGSTKKNAVDKIQLIISPSGSVSDEIKSTEKALLGALSVLDVDTFEVEDDGSLSITFMRADELTQPFGRRFTCQSSNARRESRRRACCCNARATCSTITLGS